MPSTGAASAGAASAGAAVSAEVSASVEDSLLAPVVDEVSSAVSVVSTFKS